MCRLNGYLFTFTLYQFVFVRSQLNGTVRIGGLFDTDNNEQEEAFKYATKIVTSDVAFLPRVHLVPEISRLGADESFRASTEACNLLTKGVAGIFGPQSDVSSMHVQGICESLDIPHIETRWDFQLKRDDLSINLFPRPFVLNRAYLELVKHWQWTDFVLVYEEAEGIIRLQEFLKEAQKNGWNIRLYKFPPSVPYRKLLGEIRRERKIILDVRRENIQKVLKQAQQVGMMTHEHSYLITSLDLNTIDLEDFRYGRTIIAGFRLVKSNNMEYTRLLGHLKTVLPNQSDVIKTETALIYDAVKLFAKALQDLQESKNIKFEPLSCESGIRGSDGTSFINSLKHISVEGLTGKVIFDSEGFRSTEFVLDVLYLTEEGLEQVGHWTPENGLDIIHSTPVRQDSPHFNNTNFRIAIVETKPYIMLKESTETLDDNNKYEGFCVDLLNALAKDLKFTYTLYETPDGQYGKPDKVTGEWNGIIKELMDGKAELGLVDLTINKARETQVDFTTPFMTTGISILFKKSTTKETSLFSFLSPFSMEVWAYVMAAYIGVSVTLFIVGRLCPYEWDNPHPCRQEDQVLENSYSLLNSMWFTIGSLLQQGSDVAPKATSTRVIAGIWYFFTLIMTSSYTANLAAFLTVETSVDPFSKAEDLVNQKEIEYGCLKGGATNTFFQETKQEVYRKLYKHMEENPSLYVSTNDAGIARTLKGNYAYFMEYATIEYQKERICNLTSIGGLMDNKGYGIATQKDSPHRIKLSNGILKLQEAGVLLKLRDKWWKQKRGGGRCKEDKDKPSSVKELDLGNVGGVFVVVLVGLGMASLVAALEFIWHTHKQGKPVLNEMVNELRFAVSCESSNKLVQS